MKTKAPVCRIVFCLKTFNAFMGVKLPANFQLHYVTM